MMKKFVKHLRQAERGQSIIILAIAFVVLLGFVGLTTDVSLMFVRYATIRRAVDSASLAAATQMRQGTSEANVAIAAKQFVEFHGLNSIDVLVESCQTLDRTLNLDSDPEAKAEYDAKIAELCTADQRKLVKVTVQAESPTVFLRLLGWENFTLQASAISETAALDVVLIMDVSESMLSETSYDDWAKIGMGYAFRPPHADTDIAAAKINASPPDWNGTVSDYWTQNLLGWQSITGTGGMAAVNSRLWYSFDDNGDGNPDAPFDIEPLDETIHDRYYKVDVYDLDDLDAYDNAVYPEFPTDVSQSGLVPREDCRVRFYPASTLVQPSGKFARAWRAGETIPAEPADQRFQQLNRFYADPQIGDPWDYSGGSWGGFVPSYDYYGCCNDPGVHAFDADGPIYDDNSGYVKVTTGSADFDFTDLICQPFKGARDAVELFLEKIDFIRGDRVAFVTFDRSAFLINPWDQEGQSTGGSHMIDRYDYALRTLRKVVGVRAEPNFYIWDDSSTAGGINAQWVALASEGEAIDYTSADGSGTYQSGTPFNAPSDSVYYHSYPVRDFCFLDDAALGAPYSLSNGIFGSAYTLPYPLNETQDGTNMSWTNYEVGKFGGSLKYKDIPSWFVPRVGYEFWSQCRGTNVGAALREGNNALVDPNTSRRFGAIWVMVLLGDGAAGASDPVRRDGLQVNAPKPYQTDNSGNFVPVRGDYGAFGVCPFGTTSDPGELVDDVPDMSALPLGLSFPFCSDEDPQTRHDCDFRPAQGSEALRDAGYVTHQDWLDGAITGPSTPEVEYQWNAERGHLYDLDIGADCASDYYDVDDYARDWADYVALRDPDAVTDELLPTIYTIGFGLTFGAAEGEVPEASDSVEDYLGEQLLRYIADVGDNNELDNDYYQYYDENGLGDPSILAPEDGFGFRGACQADIGVASVDDYDTNNNLYIDQGEFDAMFEPRGATQDCGNYFNAPSANELESVFDSIASKLFTRIAG